MLIPAIPLNAEIIRYLVAFIIAGLLIVFAWKYFVLIGQWLGTGFLIYYGVWAIMTNFGTQSEIRPVYSRRAERRFKRRATSSKRVDGQPNS